MNEANQGMRIWLRRPFCFLLDITVAGTTLRACLDVLMSDMRSGSAGPLGSSILLRDRKFDSMDGFVRFLLGLGGWRVGWDCGRLKTDEKRCGRERLWKGRLGENGL